MGNRTEIKSEEETGGIVLFFYSHTLRQRMEENRKLREQMFDHDRLFITDPTSSKYDSVAYIHTKKKVTHKILSIVSSFSFFQRIQHQIERSHFL